MKLMKIISGALVARCLKNLSNFHLRSFNQEKPSEEELKSINDSSKNTTDSRIVGGVNASNNEFPWIVSIGADDNGHMCGGSLIHESVVLTAGHCITNDYKDEQIYVKYGLTNLDQSKDFEKRYVKKRLLHPKYTTKEDEVLNDIALFFLKEPFSSPTLLPSFGFNDLSKKDEKVIVAGWGHTKFEGEGSNTLQKVELKTVDAKTCKKHWKYMDSNTLVCAWIKEGGKDACQGDSGGPLMKEDENGQYSQIGIVSNGKGCALPDTPGAYTRVKPYIPWIKSEMSKMNYTLEISSN